MSVLPPGNFHPDLCGDAKEALPPIAVQRSRRIPGSPWTYERIAMLTQLWADGRSTRYIAMTLGGGISKNSVIGKLHRLGIAARATPSAPRKQMSGAQKRRINPSLSKGRKLGASQSRKVKPVKAPPGLRLGPGYSDTEKPPMPFVAELWQPLPLSETHKPWLQRKAGECCWPLDVGDETYSCCAPVVRSGYCGTHARLAYRTDAATPPKEYIRGLRRWAA